MHAVWDFLFDDNFIHAYKYGMVIMCADGIERQVYPRLFTYSADYPEKYVQLLLSLESINLLNFIVEFS